MKDELIITCDDSAAEWVTLDKLREWPDNPRVHDDVDEIIRSIERFGFGAPIVARRENGEIIAGHGRFRAAQQLGIKRVPVRFMDLSEHEAHLLAIADSRLVEKTKWEAGGLADFLSDLSSTDKDLIGWTSDDLEGLLNSIDDPPAKEAKTRKKEGEALSLKDIQEDKPELNAFLERRKKSNARLNDKNENNFWLLLVFQSYDQKYEFINALNLETKYGMYVDGQDAAQKLGISITPNIEKPFKSGPEKNLAKRTMGADDDKPKIK